MSEIYAPGSIAGPPATFMGPYNASTSYSVGEAVSCGGSSYVSLVAANLGNNPATSTACWGLLAAAGAAGGSLNTTLTFMAAGSQIVSHGLNTLAPIVQASVTAGATRWSGAAIDANNYQITASGPMVASFAFLGGAAATATAPTVNLTTGLTSYWPMNEGSGSSFIDAIAANNMAATGVTWSGTEAIFNGTSSGASASTQPVPFANATTAFSVSMWVNLPSTNQAGSGQTWLICNCAADTGYILGFFGGQPTFLIFKGGSLAINVGGPASGFTTGTRQNVIYTYDGSGHAAGVQIFVNGNQVSTSIAGDALSGLIAPTQRFAAMAEYNGGTYANNVAGAMDHLRIYNRVLAAGDIAAIQTGSN